MPILTRIRALHQHYWFIPSLMAVAALGLSILMVGIDEAFTEKLDPVWWMYSGGQQVARRVLSAIAAAMIALVSLAFSITMTALTFSAQHYGSRVLRLFIRDTKSQAVLGAFISTFLYALLVLRTVHSVPDDASLPRLAVTAAIGMALASLGALIYFLYHMSEFMDASTIIAVIGRDLDRLIEDLAGGTSTSPQRAAGGDMSAALPRWAESDMRPITAGTTGYLQEIDEVAILKLCGAHDLAIQFEHRPGAFLLAGDPLALAGPAPRIHPRVDRRLRRAFLIGPRRTSAQDVEFAINQLVQVALRALSPGRNDTLTAMLCIDRLGAALSRLAARSPWSPYRHDRSGTVRIIVRAATFADLLDVAISQIREFGRHSTAVTIRLLSALETVARHAQTGEDRAAILRQAAMIERGSHELEEADRRAVTAQFEAVARLTEGLAAPTAPSPPSPDAARSRCGRAAPRADRLILRPPHPYFSLSARLAPANTRVTAFAMITGHDSMSTP